MDSLLDKLDTPKIAETPVFQIMDGVPERYSPVPQENRTVVWSGKVQMAGEGTFNGDATQICGSPLTETIWKDILSPTLSISGRINHVSATKYIFERMQQKYDILVVELTPKVGDLESSNVFRKLIKYFSTKERFAVISIKNPAIKDVYLCPVKRGNTLLPVISDLKPTESVPNIVSQDRFFATIILSSGYLGKLLHKNKSATKMPLPNVHLPVFSKEDLNLLMNPVLGGPKIAQSPISQENRDLLNALNVENVGGLLANFLNDNTYDD